MALVLPGASSDYPGRVPQTRHPLTKVRGLTFGLAFVVLATSVYWALGMGERAPAPPVEEAAETQADLRGRDREVFELLLSLRGSERYAPPNWNAAEAACKKLRWPSCERRSLEEMSRAALPDGVHAALAELAWLYGPPSDVRALTRSRDSASPVARARARLRLAVVAETPDARAALLSEACNLDPSLCDSLPAALERTAQTRRVLHEYHLMAPPDAAHAGPPPPTSGPFAPSRP